MPVDAVIRKYRPSDREAVREICCATGFMGEPASRYFDGDEIFADALTGYFTDYEPESCFVAQSGGMTVGYLAGAKDVFYANCVIRKKVIPKTLMRACLAGTLLKYKNIRFFWHCLISLARGEFSEPDFSKDYPAVLHINLRDGSRGLGLGARLIAAYMDYLASAGVRGVYFGTLSARAGDFFRGQGFKLLFEGKRSYFKYILGRDIPIYIYGKTFHK